MITKNYIFELKKNNINLLYKLIQNQRDTKSLLFILQNLGRLSYNFDGTCFTPLLNHENDNIRLWAVKNIGKINNGNYFDIISNVATNDKNSMVRREAVSTIGRMRLNNSINFLFEILKDEDPKVVLQAIRALLVFKNNSAVQNELKKLINHPNELIQQIINKEFFTKSVYSQSKQTHTSFPNYMKNIVVHGDVKEVFKYIPNESIHLTFTSPPYYNARDYSIYKSYKEYLEFLEIVFKEVHRITKEGRFFILNTSPIIIPRISRQHSSKRYPITFDIHPFLINMGWEFIDDIIWVKPEASVKNRNAGFLQHRKPLGYKPNPVTEYVMVYRKKTEKLLDWNIRQYNYETIKQSKVLENYDTSNVWHIEPTYDKVHSAVFPLELCLKIIKYYSYENDLVFDPFAGRGTFGNAALRLKRNFILTEIEGNYINRIIKELNINDLFINKRPKVLRVNEFKKLYEEYLNDTKE